MASLAAYVGMLPLAVWFLASVFSLSDRGNRPAALRRIAWRGLPLLGLALILGSRTVAPLSSALATVLAVHVVWFLGSRTAIRRGWFASPPEE